jgi:hypothetical protein
MLRDAEGARLVGGAYLRCAPQENAVALLGTLAALTKDRGRLDAVEKGQLGKLIALQRQHEFAAGETVYVDGWILSRTEAQICALVACA